MPRIGTEIVDADGVARVRAFIAAMPPGDGTCDAAGVRRPRSEGVIGDQQPAFTSVVP
jgi:hypothetical protein